jgi:hypothetical protein
MDYKIIGIILIVISIIIAIYGLIPEGSRSTDRSCGDDDTTCFLGEVCDVNSKKCVIPKRNRYYLFIISTILLVIGCVLLYFRNKSI